MNTTHRPARLAADGRTKHRDGEAATQGDAPQWSTAQENADDVGIPHPNAFEEALTLGHAWLSFSEALERRYLADTLEPRRKLLMSCSLFGILAIYFGSAQIEQLLPDVAELALQITQGILIACLLSLIAIWRTPARWRRNWQAEALSAINNAVLGLAVVYGCTVSHADTAFTHSAAMVGSIMYVCIAARQRFYWSLGVMVCSFASYLLFVRGFTPQQSLFVKANINLMALSYTLVLVANYMFEYRERRSWLLRKLEEQQRTALLQTSERLHQLSISDSLTGLFNRRQFDLELALKWASASISQQPIAMLMIDVDYFKHYNDSYGHPAGDTCLIQIGKVLSTMAARHEGIAARLGGEEFGLILPGHTLDKAQQVALGLCEAMRALHVEHRASSVADHVTVSVGVAQVWPAPDNHPCSLVSLSDRGLYLAKEHGRDRFCTGEARADDIDNLAEARPASASEVAAEISPSQEATVPLHDQPEQIFVATLAGKFRWLRFPPSLETAYWQHNARQRRKRLEAMSLLGLFIYNMYMLSSRAMFPDIQDSVLIAQLWLSMGLLAVTSLIHKFHISPRLTEAVFSLGASAVALVSAWVLSQSQHLTAMNFAVALSLIPLFSSVGARQAFWFTFMPTFVTCVSAAALFKHTGHVETLVFNDTIMMICNNALFTLILAFTLEHGARKEWLYAQIERIQGDALLSATHRLHQLSQRDPLTGLSNRRQFDEDFQRIWLESAKTQSPLALLIIDVDFFKSYNDAYGHPAGDRCLKQVAATIGGTALSAKGLAARLGGEEFGVLLPNPGPGEALRVGELICAAVRKTVIAHHQSKVPGQNIVTVSIGAADMVPHETLERHALLAFADSALYEAKNAGRNRVVAKGMEFEKPVAEVI